MSATPLVSQVELHNPEKLKLIPPLLGATVAELTTWVQQQGQPAYRGKQLHEWIYDKGVRSLSDISVFPKHWR
ncbi:MAG: 23S rRNA (adenine(2503)-C(2))-methyltransferase RlmN, partial [Nostoc sp.]